MMNLKLFFVIDMLFFTLLFCPECRYSLSRHERENTLAWEGVWGSGWRGRGTGGWNLSCLTTVYGGNWATDSFDENIPGLRVTVTSLTLQMPGFVANLWLWSVTGILAGRSASLDLLMRPHHGLEGDRRPLSTQVLKCLLSSLHVAALIAATGLLCPYSLWGWLLWMVSWHL